MGLEVSIVTPESPVAAGTYEEVLAPSALGEVGVLAGHRALLADLKEGLVVLQQGNGSETYAVSGGFLEVSDDRVTVLAESAENARDIDVDRATKALADAESKVQSLDSANPEYHAEMARARRAKVRLEAAKHAAH
jgi:F-type H+-transporting ATPase subunit epsilon